MPVRQLRRLRMVSIFRQARFVIPLLVFLIVAGFLARGLKLDSTLVPTPFLGKQAPDFVLPQLYSESQFFSPAQMAGQVWMLNVWASWCVACLHEHDDLMRLAGEGYTIVGLNYKDENTDARKWLQERGDPYILTAVDQAGTAAIDWGVYGVPETFVIDKSGKIRYKHVGPISSDTIDERIAPLVRELEDQS